MFRIPGKADATYPRQAGGFSTDIDTIAAALAGDGVLVGLGVSAQGTPDMTVAVAAGQGRIGGYFPFVAAQNVTITAADTTNPRIDIIVLDWNGAVSRVGGTAAAYPRPPAIPSNSMQLAQVYVTANATSIANGDIVDKRPVAVDFFDLYDDFNAQALTTSGNISVMSWGKSASGTAGDAFQTSVSNHPGILRMQSGTTSGNNSRLHLGASSTTGVILPSNLARARFLIRIPTITTLAVKAGFGVDVSDAAAGSLGTAGAFVEFVVATSAKWRYTTRQSSASTTNADTGADVVANNWYQFDLVRLQNGNWQFAKNMALAFTHSTNLPTTAVAFGFLAHTLTAAARNVDIDLAGLNFAPMGDRWS